MAARRVSSKDVAEAAGVSRTTVSFVLNDRKDAAIPEATRQRVWDAAHALGYTPSPEGRALKIGRSDIVLCLLPDWPITGPVGVLLKEMSADLAADGLTMLAHQRSVGDDLSSALAALTPAAIIAMCDLDASDAALAERRGIPLVAFMGKIPGHHDRATFTQEDVGSLQVSTLAEYGHTKVAYVLPRDESLSWFSEPRLKGARGTAERLGLSFDSFNDSPDPEALQAWLVAAVGSGLTAFAAYNDDVAFSLLMASAAADLQIPDDLSIMGVDDTFISQRTQPRLSTLSFDLIGEARRLVRVITQEDTVPPDGLDGSRVLTVIMRESVAAPIARSVSTQSGAGTPGPWSDKGIELGDRSSQ